MLMPFSSSYINPGLIHPVFVPLLPLYIQEPQLNRPYLIHIIDTLTRFSFLAISDCIIETYYANNNTWNDQVATKVKNFIDVTLVPDMNTAICEEIDYLHGIDEQQATNAVYALSEDDGSLSTYIIDRINVENYNAIQYLLPTQLAQGGALGVYYGLEEIDIKTNYVIIKLQPISQKLKIHYYGGV